jgi:hypothetical protein
MGPPVWRGALSGSLRSDPIQARKETTVAKDHGSSTTRAITYRFRAVVPNQAGYPWLEGSSAPVKVRVRPERQRAGERGT